MSSRRGYSKKEKNKWRTLAAVSTIIVEEAYPSLLTSPSPIWTRNANDLAEWLCQGFRFLNLSITPLLQRIRDLILTIGCFAASFVER
jgi:hypothetical protein